MFGVCQGVRTDFFVGNCRIVHKQLPLPKLRNDYRPGTNGVTGGTKPMGVRGGARWPSTSCGSEKFSACTKRQGSDSRYDLHRHFSCSAQDSPVGIHHPDPIQTKTKPHGLTIDAILPFGVNAPLSSSIANAAMSSVFWLATSRCRPAGSMINPRGNCPPVEV